MSRLQSFDDPAYTKIYSFIKKGYCKGAFREEVKTEGKTEVKKEKEPPGLTKQKPSKPITDITDEIANEYIKENTDTLTNHLRNERLMKTQRKQMNVINLLNNAFCYDLV